MTRRLPQGTKLQFSIGIARQFKIQNPQSKILRAMPTLHITNPTLDLFLLPHYFFLLMKTTLNRFAIASLGLFFVASAIRAVPANPDKLYTYRQPDGTTFQVRLIGDEHLMFRETLDGYTIERDTDGYWRYATLANGKLVPGPARVGAAVAAGASSPVAALTPHLRPSAHEQQSMRRQMPPVFADAGRGMASAAGFKAQGPPATAKLPLILIDWSGAGPGNTYSVADFNDFGNAVGYNGAYSVRDYYKEVSYNQFSLTVDVIGDNAGGWLDAATMAGGGTYDYFCNGQQGCGTYPQNSVGLCEAAINAVDPYVDFSQYDSNGDGYVDNVGLIVASYADGSNDRFWPHMSTRSWNGLSPQSVDGVLVDTYFLTTEMEENGTQAEIGACCHEYGHAIGLPDLYDYTYTSYGVGNYCIMAFGSWAGSPAGRYPSHFCAWAKAYLGWATVHTITTGGSYLLRSVEADSNIYKIPTGTSTEYFLMENRQPYGTDGSALPAPAGILIYHVDETMFTSFAPNNDKDHKFVDVECANGRDACGHTDLDNLICHSSSSHYFRSGNNNHFGAGTNPSTLLYDGSFLYTDIQSIASSSDSMTFFVSSDQTHPNRRAISYPNPFIPSQFPTVTIRTEPITQTNSIKIYNMAGQLVRSFGPSEIGGRGYVTWNGANAKGGMVASGVYMITITDMSGKVTSGRLTIVR